MHILLLEDEQAIADTLIYALGSDGHRVSHVRLVRDALSAWQQPDPECGPIELALLDVGLPDGHGFDVCRAIRRRDECLPVMFLTARAEEIDRVLGLELGADDYITKPFSPREVCARVRAMQRRMQAMAGAVAEPLAGGKEPTTLKENSALTLSGKAYADTNSIATGVVIDASTAPNSPHSASNPSHATLRLDATTDRVWLGPQCLALTRYEQQLLVALMRRPQRIFSRAELMSLVWGDASDSSDRTVDAHIKLLRAKLREHGLAADMIQTHRHLGYSYQG